jgi:hypothetical protein
LLDLVAVPDEVRGFPEEGLDGAADLDGKPSERHPVLVVSNG